MRKAITLLLAISIGSLIAGCSAFRSERENYPSLKMNDICIGMSRTEVVEIMGEPSSVSAQGNLTYLNYRLHEKNHPSGQEQTPYFVRIINSKVQAYGKSGDFDSTKPPELPVIRKEETIKILKDENIKIDKDEKIKIDMNMN
jgi:hypothetical protein